MFAAIYCRKSVNTVQGESIQSQMDHCRAYLAAHRSPQEARQAWVYRDEGFSGAGLARPAMQRLLGDIRGGRIHCVVCYRLDRISRSVSDFTALMEEFARHRVSFLCAAESFDTEKPMGRAMLYIASVFAQLERETIAERVRDNMYTLAADGRWLGGKPPFGYVLHRTPPPHPRTCLAADAQTFPLVQEVFKAVLRRGEIEDGLQLAAMHPMHPAGGFTRRFLRGLLCNPVYAAADVHSAAALAAEGCTVLFPAVSACDTGIMVYGRHPNHSRADAAMIAAGGSHPAVCSGKEWCQLRQLWHRPRPQQREPVGLLRGLLQCGLCGAWMECKRRSAREGQFDYICRSKNRQHACACPNLSGAAADAEVWQVISRRADLPRIDAVFPFAFRQSLAALLMQSAQWDGEQLLLTLRR